MMKRGPTLNLKTFVASDMPSALAMVRRELGPDAVILHTRQYKRRGLLGWFTRPVVEVTAADRSLVEKYRRTSSRPRAASASSSLSDSTLSGPAGDLIRKTYAAAMAELQRQHQTAPSHAPASPAASTAGTPTPPAASTTPLVTPLAPATDQLVREIRTVQRLVAQAIRHSTAPAEPMPGALADYYLTLLKQEVSEELADEIVRQVRRELSPPQLEDPALVQKAVQRAVASLIPVDPTAGKLLPTPDGRPRTIALIGPTGVGKTTTIAKLAATFKLRDKKRIALITFDTYRIAAVEQLRTYAQIVGLPLHVASTVDEARAAARACAGFDAVFIDTPGRSQRDDPRLDQLAALLAAVQPHETHLVLSSTATQSVLLEAVQRFSKLNADRIIFTKLDEAVSFGVLLNVIRSVNRQLSFVTTGQEVPHHIEPGRPQRLAALLLGENL